MNVKYNLSYLILFLISLFFLSEFTFAQNWALVWADEFDGTQLDESSWTRETGGNGWGNNELEYYTNRTNNSYVSNGVLTIVAQLESYGGRDYTSARLKTEGKKSFKYGKIEARIKLPYGQGIWPAFWMLGESISFVGWPACGEIDIMEMIGGDNNRDKTVHGTAHWDDNGHKHYGLNYVNSAKFSDDFHVFSIVWDSLSIKWYMDGNQFCTFSTTPSALSEFHSEFFIILNLAVGGNWPGNPDITTVFPQKMEIDYVRVYQLSNTTSTEDEKQIPREFNLDQNYPNPFNPQTTINYNIPESSFVSLKVFDSLGHLVKSLIDEEKSAGNYNVTWNGDNSSGQKVSSGTYFYKIEAGDYIETKKMILLR